VTFYRDENLSPRIAELLRTHGLDATSAHEVGNTHLDDRTQLRYAAREGRAIVTGDILDFTELAGEFIAASMRHAGIGLIAPTFRTETSRRLRTRWRRWPMSTPTVLPTRSSFSSAPRADPSRKRMT
jgi:hypothetical protein